MHIPNQSTLFACFALLIAVLAAPLQADEPFSSTDELGRAVYLIEFKEPGLLQQHRARATGQRFSINDAAMQSAQAALMSTQAEHIRGLTETLGRAVRPTHYYLVSHSGMALRLTPEEARRVSELPEVASIKRERVYELMTYRGPSFIGAPTLWDGTNAPGGALTDGQGVIAAILDSGIPDPAGHDSFANVSCGYDSGTPKTISALDCSSTDGTGLCNGSSPFDTNGHGSHTASTVAGNAIDASATPSPTVPGSFTEMSGVAPCARIRAYKTCPGSSCPGADIQAGMESVLIHADVTAMNFSISGGRNPWTDNDRRKLDLVDNGVFVAASAGNTGPGNPDPVGDVNHVGPWVMSVAASTRDTNNSGSPSQGDVLAGFSLRGPSPPNVRDLQKPDITGPGVNIYAAVPGGYNFLSGTSMSSPHVAGAGLLVAQANPTWTPMEVKSALQMSSFNGGFIENGSTPWDPDDVGSGRVDLTKAALSGLVMDETFANFLAADPSSGGDVRTLNLPSVRHLDCTPSCTFTRTVRNTLGTASSWTATGAAFDSNFNIEVTPSAFTFTGDTAETQTLEITLLPTADTTSTIAFGEIVLSEVGAQSPDLRITAAMSGVGGPAIAVAPGDLSFSLDAGTAAGAPLTISNTGTLDLNWTISESLPDGVGDARGAVAITETLTIPDFTVDPTNPVSVDVMAGVANSGTVLGFDFDGTVTTIGTNDWASDMRMVVTSPGGPSFEVGGFDAVVNPWDFQGGGSTNAGTYSSSHPTAFAPGTTDAGNWNIQFEHGWASGNPMAWEAVTVTLLKEAIICENAADISWLSVDTTAGTTAPGGDSLIQVVVDTAGLAVGTYNAQVCVNSDATNASIVAVPVSLEVTDTGGPTPATLTGSVQSLGYCNADSSMMGSQEVVIQGQNNTISTFTDGSGAYSINVNISESPVNITVSPANHLPQSVSGVTLTESAVISNDFDVVLAAPCADVSDMPMAISMPVDGSDSIDLVVDNSNGGGELDWAITTEGVVSVNPRGHFPAQSWTGELVSDANASWGLDPNAGSTNGTGFEGLLGGSGPLGYSTTGFTADGYLSMDVTAPGAQNLINGTQPELLFAGTFIDNDFTRQYAIATGRAPAPEPGDVPADTFGYIDTATGTFTAEGVVTGGSGGTWTSLAWDATTSTLYAVNVPGSGTNNLYTIDTNTLVATLVGVIPGDIVIAIAIDDLGQMYAVDLGTDTFLTVDKTDASAATVGPLGLNANFAQDMDFDRDTDTLYWAAYLGGGDSRMTTIDLATGAATEVGAISNGNELLNLSIATAGAPPVCANPGVVPWLDVTPSSGPTAAASSDTVSVNFDATGLAPGVYEAYLCMDTSDANNDFIAIPVSMTVLSGTDELFQDRFQQ